MCRLRRKAGFILTANSVLKPICTPQAVLWEFSAWKCPAGSGKQAGSRPRDRVEWRIMLCILKMMKMEQLHPPQLVNDCIVKVVK